MPRPAIVSGAPAATTEELTLRGHVGTTEDRRRDETLTGFCLSGSQSL